MTQVTTDVEVAAERCFPRLSLPPIPPQVVRKRAEQQIRSRNRASRKPFGGFGSREGSNPSLSVHTAVPEMPATAQAPFVVARRKPSTGRPAPGARGTPRSEERPGRWLGRIR